MKLKVNFNLKSGVTNNIPIIATITFGVKEFDELKKVYIYKPLRYYTGIKVEINEWDQKLKMPLEKSKKIELLKLEETIQDVFNFLKHKNSLNNESFKIELDQKIKGKSISKIDSKVRIVDFIEQVFLKTHSIKEESKKPYQGLANKIKDFEKSFGKPLYTNDLNEEIYLEFMDQIRQKLNKINGVWTVQKCFKAILKAISRKYKIKVLDITNDLSKNDKVQAVSIDAVYMTFEQIKKIIDYKPKTEKLKNTKLILLTLLFTGCRESDVYKIKPEHYYNKNGESFFYAHYFSQKTDTEIIVPILKPLLDAFNENDGKPAYPISQQKFNDYAKELVRLSEITEEYTITFIDSYGKKHFETKPFDKFVSSHIGRRSFITNLINHIPVTILTKITGHTLKDKSIIFGYNKISLLDNAIEFRRKLKQLTIENPKYFIIKLI